MCDQTVHAAAFVPSRAILAIFTVGTFGGEAHFGASPQTEEAGKLTPERMPARSLNVV